VTDYAVTASALEDVARDLGITNDPLAELDAFLETADEGPVTEDVNALQRLVLGLDHEAAYPENIGELSSTARWSDTVH
jgi:hypothetical protein